MLTGYLFFSIFLQANVSELWVQSWYRPSLGRRAMATLPDADEEYSWPMPHKPLSTNTQAVLCRSSRKPPVKLNKRPGSFLGYRLYNV